MVVQTQINVSSHSEQGHVQTDRRNHVPSRKCWLVQVIELRTTSFTMALSGKKSPETTCNLMLRFELETRIHEDLDIWNPIPISLRNLLPLEVLYINHKVYNVGDIKYCEGNGRMLSGVTTICNSYCYRDRSTIVIKCTMSVASSLGRMLSGVITFVTRTVARTAGVAVMNCKWSSTPYWTGGRNCKWSSTTPCIVGGHCFPAWLKYVLPMRIVRQCFLIRRK